MPHTALMAEVKVPGRSGLQDLIHYRLRVVSVDGRAYLGELLAFDSHMNLVLGDCVEERLVKGSTVKRTLGLMVLRGAQVLTTVVEDQPVTTKRERLQEVKSAKVKHAKLAKKAKKAKTVSKPSKTSKTNRPSKPEPPRKQFQPPPGLKRKR